MLGTSLYYLGDLSNARRHLEHVLSHCTAPLRRSHMIRFQFDLPVTTRGTLARVLWLQGFPDQAMRMAEDNVEDARAIDHVVSLYWALDGVCMLALAVGDQTTVERSLAMLLGYSAKHALGFWQALGHSYEGQLQIKRGNVATGVRSLRAGLEELRKARYVLRFPGLLGELAEGMARVGQHRQALEVIHEALAQCEGTDERWSMAELLPIKGKLLLLEGGSAAWATAEDHFRQALDWAHRQGALSLELRTVMDLAQLLRDQGEATAAFALLASAYGRFTEGFGTTDLKRAKALLEALR
jgi:predicted ATPase